MVRKFPTSIMSLFSAHFLDFLAVRKIPLKEHPYITENQEQQQQQKEAETRSEDPNVTSFLNKVRIVLKTDRAIHDLVKFCFSFT